MTDPTGRPVAAARGIPTTLGWGLILALGAAMISGGSIFLNAFAVRLLPDPVVFTTLKNAVAAAMLVGLALATVRPADVRAIPAGGWARLAVVGVIGGGVPFILFFTGLAEATAPSAAFIQKTLFVWVAILAVPFLGERLGLAQIAALGVLLAGQLLAAAPTGVAWGTGETMIAAATLLWAVEAILAKRLLRSMPVAVLGAGRLAIGLLVLAGYLLATGRASVALDLDGAQLVVALGTGVLLAGYVGTWFAALKRAPASLVTAVLVVGAPVTAALQALQGGALAPSPALAGQAAILLAAGVLAVLALRRPRPAPAVA